MKFVQGDTICAIATPPGAGALAIVRLSGPDTSAILRKAFGDVPEERRATLAKLAGESGLIDTAIVVFYRGPASYTGEDMAEVTVHGGPAVVSRALAVLISAGARPAEPGEFTWRALLNGKMDLVQVQAVADMAAAETDSGHLDALARLEGILSARFKEIRDEVMRVLGELEADINFEIEMDPKVFRDVVGALIDKCRNLSQDAPPRRLVTTGLKVALAGPRNAGKSTLFNALLGEERAIVTAIPGTTTDRIETVVVWDGRAYRLSDCAGLAEEARDEVEAEGIRRCREFAKSADVFVWVEDGTKGVTDIPDDIVPNDMTVIRVRNKSDLPGFTVEAGALPVSALNGEGISEVIAAICGAVPGYREDAVTLAAREREALANATGYLGAALSVMQKGYLDQVAQELRGAADEIGRILGEIEDEELLNAIFKDFCVGK
jgi:tRNA modification GTPase